MENQYPCHLKAYKVQIISLRKPKIFALQILRLYLTKEGFVLKFFYYLIWIKEPYVRKFGALARSKILGISQTIMLRSLHETNFTLPFLDKKV